MFEIHGEWLSTILKYLKLCHFTHHMGIVDLPHTKQFTNSDLKNKRLIVDMLQYEDTLIHGEVGQSMYKTPSYYPRKSLTIEHALHRLVLQKFGFSNTDTDVATYRSIYRNYYDDIDVLRSVTYMRENKCLYYKRPIVEIGDIVSDQLKRCNVYDLNNTPRNLFDVVNSLTAKHIFVGAFSGS